MIRLVSGQKSMRSESTRDFSCDVEDGFDLVLDFHQDKQDDMLLFTEKDGL